MKEKAFTTDTTQTQKIMRDYFEQLYANELNILEQTDKFLETGNLPELNHHTEIKKSNRPVVMSKDTESVIKNLPISKVKA